MPHVIFLVETGHIHPKMDIIVFQPIVFLPPKFNQLMSNKKNECNEKGINIDNYDSSLIAASINENGYMEYKPIVYDYFSDTTFNNDQCAKCKLLPVCFGPCVQKRFENVYQGKPFQCLHDKSEISITQFIKDLYEQRH